MLHHMFDLFSGWNLPDIWYPTILLARYPAKSEFGTTLPKTQMNLGNILICIKKKSCLIYDMLNLIVVPNSQHL